MTDGPVDIDRRVSGVAQLLIRWHSILLLVDSRVVGPFKTIMYTCFFLGALSSELFSAHTVAYAPRSFTYLSFSWLSLVCPLLVLAGAVMCRGETKQPQARVTSGYLLRTGGDIGMTFALVAFTTAVGPHSTYSMFMSGGLACCTALLAFANIRKLVLFSHWEGLGNGNGNPK